MQRVREVFNRFRLGHLAHFVQNVLLTVVILLLVRLDLTIVAAALVIISKWRIFAVQPRHWLANIRANSTDIIVGLSVVALLYMIGLSSVAGVFNAASISQILLIIFYAVWLVFVKPLSTEAAVAFQALTGQIIGITSLLWLANINDLPESVIIILAWFISLTSSRHFLSSYEEPLISALSFSWALIIAELVWLLNRWTIVYSIGGVLLIAQLSLVLVVLSYYAGTLYYLEKKQRLSRQKAFRMISFACAIMLIIIIFSNWTIDI